MRHFDDSNLISIIFRGAYVFSVFPVSHIGVITDHWRDPKGKTFDESIVVVGMVLLLSLRVKAVLTINQKVIAGRMDCSLFSSKFFRSRSLTASRNTTHDICNFHLESPQIGEQIYSAQYIIFCVLSKSVTKSSHSDSFMPGRERKTAPVGKTTEVVFRQRELDTSCA
jgi:hypothetical protein